MNVNIDIRLHSFCTTKPSNNKLYLFLTMMFSNKRGVRLPSPDKGQGAARDYPEPGSLFPQYSDPVPDDEYNNEGEFVVDHINDEEFIDFTNVMSDGKLMAGSAAATTTPQFKMFSTKKTPTTDKTIPLHAQTDETMSDDGTRYTHPSEFPCMSPPRPKYIYSHDPNNQNNETAITEEDKLTKVWIKYRLCILLAILVALVLMIIVLPISVSKGKANSSSSSSLNKASPTIAPSVYTGNAYEANIDMFPPSIIQAQPTASVPIGTPSAAPVRLSKPTNKPSDMGPTTFPTSFTMEPTSGQPTPLPTTQPPTVPRQHPLVGVLYQVTPADKLLNPFTPQGEALSWLVAADKQVPNFRAPERIVQRYAMTVLDVALHAPNPRLWSARYLHECKWAGVTCNDQKHVTEINWARQELQGTIPAELGLLSHLEKLDVAQNNLKGTLDPLYSLTKLKHAYLFENYLTGTLSEKLENCRNMTRLFIGHNDLTGTIPALDLRPLGRSSATILYCCSLLAFSLVLTCFVWFPFYISFTMINRMVYASL